MRILAIADEESKALWDYYSPEQVEGVDLIIACGDLRAAYLEFLVTMTNRPLLYVRGNHDGAYQKNPPEGCICIEDRVYDFQGLRILGLGGSQRYSDAPADMYTEKEMSRRIRKAAPDILLRNGFDLLVTHAPAAGYGDMDDLPHRGFACFNDLMDRYHPRYMLHGHVHQSYGAGRFTRRIVHPSGTTIVNACGHCFLDIAPEEYPQVGKTGSFLYDLVMTVKEGKKQNRQKASRH